jgi:pyroglutamyl-peptidase
MKINNIKVRCSTDPGRYICNYIYFQSLHKYAQTSTNTDVVFIHVPPETVIPLEAQIAFIDNVIELWQQQVSQPLSP